MLDFLVCGLSIMYRCQTVLAYIYNELENFVCCHLTGIYKGSFNFLTLTSYMNLLFLTIYCILITFDFDFLMFRYFNFYSFLNILLY